MLLTDKRIVTSAIRSKDGRRYGLSNLAIEPDGTVVATDGTAMTWHQFPGAELEERVYLGDDVCKAIKRARKNDPVEVHQDQVKVNGHTKIPLVDQDVNFPNYQAILPTEAGYQTAGVDPKYLAKIGKGAAELGVGLLLVSLKDKRSPAKFEGESPDGVKFRAILMPMTVDGPICAGDYLDLALDALHSLPRGLRPDEKDTAGRAKVCGLLLSATRQELGEILWAYGHNIGHRAAPFGLGKSWEFLQRELAIEALYQTAKLRS